MSVQTIHGSTADNSTGVAVPGAVAEGSIPPPPWGVGVGNKETFAATSRTGLTAADAPTGGDLTTGGFGSAGLVDCSNCLNVAVRATCNTASAALSGRLVFYDSSSNCLSISTTLAFVSDPTLRLGNGSGDYVCNPQLVDVGAARQCKFLVDSISAGTWAVYVRPI